MIGVCLSDRAIAMMACEPFPFHGRSLAVFQCFEATPKEAARLTAQGVAVARHKRYQTADLRPMSDDEVVAPPVDVSLETPPVKTKRAYRRRDVKAKSL